MTVEAIKEAIEQLTETERHAVAEWLLEIEEQAWDAEMERDFSPAGRGHTLVNKINHEIDSTKFCSLEEGLRSRQKRN
ncbi:MAG TPA: hypothetical protein VG028_06540 [Terriglobia bacterium]|nr:hypothetical protein [Terriglobia bacterium]